MTSFKVDGFISGYMGKEAVSLGDVTLALGGIAKLLPYLFMVPVGLGAGAGLLHSKMTSPAKMDISTAQNALELAELEEFATELTRRREAAERQGKKENSNARTLRL